MKRLACTGSEWGRLRAGQWGEGTCKSVPLTEAVQECRFAVARYSKFSEEARNVKLRLSW